MVARRFGLGALRALSLSVAAAAFAGCALGPERGALDDDLESQSVAVPSETTPILVLRTTQIVDRYDRPDRPWFGEILAVQGDAGLAIPGAAIGQMLEYDEMQKESESDAERQRRTFPHGAPSLACTDAGPVAPLRSESLIGAHYLARLFVDGMDDPPPLDVFANSYFAMSPPPTLPSDFDRALTVLLANVGTGRASAMFCDPLDAEAMFPALRPLEDTHPALFGSPFMFFNELIEAYKTQARANGPYIPGALRRLLEQELDHLRRYTASSSGALDEYGIAIRYEDHTYALSVSAQARMISISATLVRYVLMTLAQQQAIALADLQRRVDVGVLSQAEGEQRAFALAKETRRRFREAFRLALAHELAHVYLGTDGGLAFDEALADCHAVSNVRRSGEVVTLGIVDLLETDRDAGDIVLWSGEQYTASDLEVRVARLRTWAKSDREADAFAASQCTTR